MLRMVGTTSISIAGALLLLTLLAGCAQPPLKASPTHITSEPSQAGNIPAPVQAPAILPRPKATVKSETYSVVVNGVRVQELLFALARDAKLNVDINAGITGTVTLNAIDQTLQQLLTRISRQVDMRWELDGPNLLVMPDSPFLRVYKVDYVNMERKTTGTFGVSSQVGAASGGAGGGGGSNASTTSVTNSSNSDFWKSLIENIQNILKETDKDFASGGNAPTAIPVAAPATAGAPTAPGSAPTPPTIPALQQVGPSARDAASVIANREAGIINIRATSRQHEKIQEFLDRVLANTKRQVLIEATIVEIQLSNQYQQGIDWSVLRRGPAGINLTQRVGGDSTVIQAPVNSQALTIGIADPSNRFGGITATIKLLESFGNVKVLSSPKMSVLNNQTALLKVVNNLVYFTIKADTTQGSTGPAVTTFTTTPNTVPVGFVMNVTPQISDDDTVMLNVRPSVTRVISFIQDPNPSLAGVSSLIPQIQTREMESMLKINSGQIAILGGLITDSYADNEDSTPGVNTIPGIRNLFLNTTRASTKSELVVFIRPLVVKDPSIDGDYRSFRAYLPDDEFMARPNPGKPIVQ